MITCWLITCEQLPISSQRQIGHNLSSHRIIYSSPLQQLYLLGDTRRCELLVFAEANPARLPTEMCFWSSWWSPAVLLAVLTGRSNLCVAGVFGAGLTRSLHSATYNPPPLWERGFLSGSRLRLGHRSGRWWAVEPTAAWRFRGSDRRGTRRSFRKLDTLVQQLLSLFCFWFSALWLPPQDCEACPDASLFTVGSMDAPCWLLCHGPIVTVNSFHAIACWSTGESQEAMV